ncbi:unnamed protein product [Orchesella dallaii]|uniref:Methyltransferase type 11 domain-containing protein n=1 Tax=Orchesella dallaii TaxID=48710 RepID=A0ABP1QI14_9HEXA
MSHLYWEGAAIAARYAKYRPIPPAGLINRILEFLKEKYTGPLNIAYDVGCGSGQSTQFFAPHFSRIVGTDLSPSQVEQAAEQNKYPNIFYKVSPAETIPEKDCTVQLISASQAAHWFDLPKFYEEGRRALCKGGVLCMYGYELPKFVWPKDPSKEKLLNAAMMDFYNGDLAHYVLTPSKELYLGRYTLEKFNISFAPETVRDESFCHDVESTVEDMVMYTATWSGFNNFCKKNGDEAGLKLLEKYRNKLMEILNVPTSPAETYFTKRSSYFMLMGRNL